MKKQILIFLMILFSLAGVGGAMEAHAQAKTFGAAKPLPEIVFLPQADFEAKTRLVRNKSPDDEYLAYEVNVPRGWSEVQGKGENFLLGSKMMSTLAEFESPNEELLQKSRLMIQAIELDRPVTPERWLLEHMISLGRHIEYMGIHSNSRAEALIAYVHRGQSYVERTAVEINGQRALMISYTIPVEAWERENVMQAQVVAGFKVLNEFEGVVENYHKHQFLDAAELRYPFDWNLKAGEIETSDRMKVSLLNLPDLNIDLHQSNEVDGLIEVELVSIYGTEALTPEIERQQKVFRDQGFDMAEHNEVNIPSAFYIDRAFEFAKTQAFVSPSSGKRVLEKEAWFAVLGAGDYYYFVKMLTPSRKSDYYLWLRNTEVFKFVVEGLRPNLATKAL